MKNFTKTTFLLVLVAFAFGGCAPKTSKTVVNNTTTNPITDSDGDGIADENETGSDTVEGCNGVYREGATSCYVASLPTTTVMGPGTLGYTYYSTASGDTNGLDPNKLMSDRVFSVRVKASRIAGGTAIDRKTGQTKSCSTFTTNSFGKMQVKVTLSKSGANGVGEQKTFTADVATSSGYSTKQYFTVPGGSSEPLVLTVTEVLTDHRCLQKNGSSYCPYADIPVNTAGPTECVGVKLEFATDSTYGLP